MSKRNQINFRWTVKKACEDLFTCQYCFAALETTISSLKDKGTIGGGVVIASEVATLPTYDVYGGKQYTIFVNISGRLTEGEPRALLVALQDAGWSF